LIGGNRSNEGIIVAFNPVTGIEGPICGEDWDLKDVSKIKVDHKQLYWDNMIAFTIW